MTIEIKAVVKTSSGMLALWDAEAFAGVVDYDTWEAELCLDEDIQNRVRAGDLVPINIESDGAFEVLVRYGNDPVLTEREVEHLVVSSQPYLLVSSGDVRLSGIEGVGWADDAVDLAVGAGEHDVVLHIIDWHAEPGSTTEDGNPTPHALPDFVVLVSPASGDGPYRDELLTFPPPGLS
ncbi:hypothetical protein [Actinophytocola sp.]|uniref:hypothetical protein n=1 Tax=Actinophytocola sp. TaxID=1872138 RepID=UPI003899890E